MSCHHLETRHLMLERLKFLLHRSLMISQRRQDGFMGVLSFQSPLNQVFIPRIGRGTSALLPCIAFSPVVIDRVGDCSIPLECAGKFVPKLLTNSTQVVDKC